MQTGVEITTTWTTRELRQICRIHHRRSVRLFHLYKPSKTNAQQAMITITMARTTGGKCRVIPHQAKGCGPTPHTNSSPASSAPHNLRLTIAAIALPLLASRPTPALTVTSAGHSPTASPRKPTTPNSPANTPSATSSSARSSASDTATARTSPPSPSPATG